MIEKFVTFAWCKPEEVLAWSLILRSQTATNLCCKVMNGIKNICTDRTCCYHLNRNIHLKTDMKFSDETVSLLSFKDFCVHIKASQHYK